MQINDNKLEIFLHFVWATHRRQPFLVPNIEARLHRLISTEATKLGCTVLALNGTVDHVHCLVEMPATTSIANLVKRMKGVSATATNKMSGYEPSFNWQRGYACFSVSRRDVRRVVRYIDNQKQHHAEAKLWETCELNLINVASLRRPAQPPRRTF